MNGGTDWAISLIALIFVMPHSPAAERLFPILGSGGAVGILLLSATVEIRSLVDEEGGAR
jgi:hypothetical protein